MNPINIPTDNLYKFIAISGLILFLVGLLGTAYLMHESIKQINEARGQEFKANTITLWAKSYQDRIEEILKHPEKEQNKEYLEYLKKVYRCYLDKEKDRFFDNIDYRAGKIASFIDLKLTKFLIISCLSLIVLGTSIAVLGFILWYNKVQKYLDIKLKNEALSEQRKKRRIRYI